MLCMSSWSTQVLGEVFRTEGLQVVVELDGVHLCRMKNNNSGVSCAPLNVGNNISNVSESFVKQRDIMRAVECRE